MTDAISKAIADTYGSKKGLLRFVVFGILQRLGYYRRYRPLGVEQITRLVFICSGNICRSPLGEYVAKSLDFPTVSYGLHCRGGDMAFEKTLSYGRKTGFDIEQHLSSNISQYAPQEGDLLIVMEPRHAQAISEQYPDTPALLLGFLSEKNNVYIHDPYNTNQVFFDDCMDLITRSTQRLIGLIRAEES